MGTTTCPSSANVQAACKRMELMMCMHACASFCLTPDTIWIAIEPALHMHLQATGERMDTLTTVARTASEARAQQQERMDAMDKELKVRGGGAAGGGGCRLEWGMEVAVRVAACVARGGGGECKSG